MLIYNQVYNTLRVYVGAKIRENLISCKLFFIFFIFESKISCICSIFEC